MDCVNTRTGKKRKERLSLGCSEKITIVKSGSREARKSVLVCLPGSGSPLTEFSICSFTSSVSRKEPTLEKLWTRDNWITMRTVNSDTAICFHFVALKSTTVLFIRIITMKMLADPLNSKLIYINLRGHGKHNLSMQSHDGMFNFIRTEMICGKR